MGLCAGCHGTGVISVLKIPLWGILSIYSVMLIYLRNEPIVVTSRDHVDVINNSVSKFKKFDPTLKFQLRNRTSKQMN